MYTRTGWFAKTGVLLQREKRSRAWKEPLRAQRSLRCRRACRDGRRHVGCDSVEGNGGGTGRGCGRVVAGTRGKLSPEEPTTSRGARVPAAAGGRGSAPATRRRRAECPAGTEAKRLGRDTGSEGRSGWRGGDGAGHCSTHASTPM